MLKLFIRALVALTALSFVSRFLFIFLHSYLFVETSLKSVALALLSGLMFDLSLSAYLLSPLVLLMVFLPFQRIKSFLPYGLALSGLALVVLHITNHFYFWESGRHLSYELRSLPTYIHSMGETFTTYPVKATALVLLACGIYILFLSVFKAVPRAAFSVTRHFVHSFFILVLTIGSIRGFFHRAPLKPNFAFHLSHYQLSLLYGNGAYNALYYLINNKKQVSAVELPKVESFDFLSQFYPASTQKPMESAWAEKPNVLLILLESWPAHRMKSYGATTDTTPFFDQLRKKSLSPVLGLAGGHRTSEGLFAMSCSYQNPLGQAIPQSQIEFHPYHCLPHILRDQLGYHTAFFQGTNKETSGIGSFAQSLGFSESFGKQDIVEQSLEKNSWGFHDQDIYNFVLQKMKTAQSPFFYGINTNTTHDHHMPQGVETAFKDNFLKTLSFADRQLKAFFEELEATGLLQNTLVVLAADHTAYTHDTIVSEMAVPLLIYHPKLPPREMNFVSSHKDLAPTILDVLGHPSPQHFQGQSWLRDYPVRFAEAFHLGQLLWFNTPDEFLQMDVYKNQLSCFKYAGGTQITEQVCTKDHVKASQEALSFTSYSQSLLFEGRTREFNSPRPQSSY